MAKVIKTSFALMLLLLLPLSLLIKVTGFRSLPYYYSAISDGVGDIHRYTTYTTEKCEQMYGFLPCSKSISGHFFLIVVYEYLLFHGEYYVAMGGERIFKILGFLVQIVCLVQVHCVNRDVRVTSGLLNSKEVAQGCVLTGVGLLKIAVSCRVLLCGCYFLLFLCLFHVLFRLCLPSLVRSRGSTANSLYTSSEVVVWTAYIFTLPRPHYMGRITVLWVIPFVIILVPTVLHLSATLERIFMIFSLVVSIVYLFSYFFYQQVTEFLSTRCRLFEKADQDGDKFVSVSELKQLFMKIRSRKLYRDKDYKMSRTCIMDDFVKGFTRWIDETKDAMGKRYHSIRSLKDFILQAWLKKKREEHEMMNHILSDIFQHVESTAIGTLYTEDGKPNISAIRKRIGK
ncbi:sodium/calcium exchanger NCL1-like [Capsicum annuum]